MLHNLIPLVLYFSHGHWCRELQKKSIRMIMSLFSNHSMLFVLGFLFSFSQEPARDGAFQSLILLLFCLKIFLTFSFYLLFLRVYAFFTLKKNLKIAMAYNKNPLSKWGGVKPFKVEHQIVENSYWLSGPPYIYCIKRGYLIISVTVIKTNAYCSVECYSLKL